MISKNKLKYFASLHQKKFRKQYGRFLAEGEKIVREILTGRNTFLEPATLLAEPSFTETLKTIPPGVEVLSAGTGELRKISSLSNAATAILEIRIPEFEYL
ncbi:MAG TPA: RNA methyltransferase, partial [Bacteroidales bacterium]|nr:RNA methyltransferase [Bacteroidales bacterium]